jgi:hypothetical protein
MQVIARLHEVLASFLKYSILFAETNNACVQYILSQQGYETLLEIKMEEIARKFRGALDISKMDFSHFKNQTPCNKLMSKTIS